MMPQQSRRGRNRLRACKLRLELGGLPGVNETIAPKAKWRHRRTYQRVRERIRAIGDRVQTLSQAPRYPDFRLSRQLAGCRNSSGTVCYHFATQLGSTACNNANQLWRQTRKNLSKTALS